ncbi:MAG TPA: ISKra4 family transposase, partial [Nitrospiraceae bacterium]|nr:ISKra4 family transposase [Nitrospiraceae bacterium]
KVARAVLGANPKKMHLWAEERRKELYGGGVNKVIQAIRKLSPSTEQAKEICEKAIGYFQKNKERMKYDEFRKQGLFVGSGVVEAGCRTVVGQRLKQSGMHWTVEGANSIIALRSCFLSNRWEDFWETRSCA